MSETKTTQKEKESLCLLPPSLLTSGTRFHCRWQGAGREFCSEFGSVGSLEEDHAVVVDSAQGGLCAG